MWCGDVAEGFLLEAFFGGLTVVWVDLTSGEIESEAIGCNARGSAAEVCVENVPSGFGEVREHPSIECDGFLCGMYAHFVERFVWIFSTN